MRIWTVFKKHRNLRAFSISIAVGCALMFVILIMGAVRSSMSSAALVSAFFETLMTCLILGGITGLFGQQPDSIIKA